MDLGHPPPRQKRQKWTVLIDKRHDTIKSRETFLIQLRSVDVFFKWKVDDRRWCRLFSDYIIYLIWFMQLKCYAWIKVIMDFMVKIIGKVLKGTKTCLIGELHGVMLEVKQFFSSIYVIYWFCKKFILLIVF